ncbi:MAG: MmgE/PrpD family protein [Actinomycetota bacterium]|nr:MmgE/PrpD family protein [Actinomycetota bacterium]
MSILEEAAAWISSLRLDDIPPRIVEKTRHQILNILAAAAAGTRTEAGQSLMRAFPDGQDEKRVIPRGGRSSLEEAILVGCSLSMTMDYDDYLFLGHTGHSAVMSSLLLGNREGLRLSQVIPAVVAANETAGRLGAATVLGPRNGQMWSYIHLAGGAAAASRILGLDRERTTHALALALYQPVLPLYPGFMGGESKVLTAASPTVLGVQAALMGAAGLKGNPDIAEGEGGFLDELSFLPATFFLNGWGRSWVSDTLAYKPYPGCAYLDTTLDAWDEIKRDFLRDTGKPPVSDEIEGTEVEASLLTIGMDDLSRTYRGASPLSPVNINFSVATSLALAIFNGRLTPGCLQPSYLEEHRREIMDLASKTRLSHDWAATFELLETLNSTLDLPAALGRFSPAELLSLRRDLKGMLVNSDMDWREALGAAKAMPSRFKRGLTRALLRAALHPFKPRKTSPFDFGGVKLEDLRMPFPARLTLRMKRGREYSARCGIPRGAPGSSSYLEEVSLKWHRETDGVLGEKRAERAAEMVLREDPPVSEILDTMAF